jgi:thioredoxin-like negative regulator of GroEL
VRAALESGEVTDALRTAEEALSRATHDVSLQYLAAEAALRVGDLARARAIYAQIVAEHPDELRAREALRALSPE